jgi:hypothetical protein
MKKKLTSFLPWKNIWRRFNGIIDSVPSMSYYDYGERIIIQGLVSEYATIDWKNAWKDYSKNKSHGVCFDIVRIEMKQAIEENIISYFQRKV